MRTFSIEPQGKKWATVCRTDGYWAITFLSKNKRRAKRKGEDFVDGTRTATRKYVTQYGQALNEARSNLPRGVSPSKARLAAAMTVAFNRA